MVRSRLIRWLLILYSLAFLAWGDTFTNKITGEVLHGYSTGLREGSKNIVHTEEKGRISLTPEQWNVSPNRIGRKNTVVIIPFEGALNLKIVSDALYRAVNKACSSGPAQVILEIDSPGGKTEYIERLCDLIIRIDYCQTAAYLDGGQHRGALGSSAAIALACDRIYMASNTTIGAATLVKAEADTNSVKLSPADENLSVAWQQYLAFLAERRGRPGLLVKAMVDKDTEVIEVIRNGKPVFIGPSIQGSNDLFVRTWSGKDSLLTLTAAEARQCQISEAIVADRTALLKKLDLSDAEVIIQDDAQQALATFRKSKLKYERLRRQLDAQIKKLELTEDLPEAMTLLRDVIDGYKSMLFIARRYPDLYLDVELIEEQLNTAEDYYEKAKDKQRQLDANSIKNGPVGE